MNPSPRSGTRKVILIKKLLNKSESAKRISKNYFKKKFLNKSESAKRISKSYLRSKLL